MFYGSKVNGGKHFVARGRCVETYGRYLMVYPGKISYGLSWISTLEDLFEVSEEALSCFILAMDDAVDTSIWASLQELVCLMIFDKENRVSRSVRPRLHIKKELLDFLVEQG